MLELFISSRAIKLEDSINTFGAIRIAMGSFFSLRGITPPTHPRSNVTSAIYLPTKLFHMLNSTLQLNSQHLRSSFVFLQRNANAQRFLRCTMLLLPWHCIHFRMNNNHRRGCEDGWQCINGCVGQEKRFCH